jgi:hypothetical protein
MSKESQSRRRSLDHWSPGDYVDDPLANAVLNVARQIGELAAATNGLLYGLKYGKQEGMSIAEATEVAGGRIADALTELAGGRIADALTELAQSVDNLEVPFVGRSNTLDESDGADTSTTS